MAIGRRGFLGILGASAAASYLPATGAAAIVANTPRAVKALAFDAFPIFDPRPIEALAEALFPGKGSELTALWRTRQFEYTWLRSSADRYTDFEKVTDDALVYATRAKKLELTPDARRRLTGAYLEMKPWPDVPEALAALKKSGLTLAFLSNATPRMLESSIAASGLKGTFSHAISTDRVGAYKPDPRAYRLGMEVLGLAREEILFVAFAGWDAAGAKWFGYPTFWVNRLGQPVEELGVQPDGTGKGMADLVNFVGARRSTS